MSKPSIVIDAGHGGRDPGAVGPGGLQEKDVALTVALITGGLLVAGGVEVYYTRKEDTFVELPERARIANRMGVDLFLSIHCNSASTPGSGFEVYTTPGETASDPFATELFLAFGREFPEKPRRVDTKDGDPDKEANFAVLRQTDMAAALFELEFIHTRDGEDFLRNPVNQGKCAKALAAGVFSYLKLPQPTTLEVTEDEATFRREVKRLASELYALAG